MSSLQAEDWIKCLTIERRSKSVQEYFLHALYLLSFLFNPCLLNEAYLIEYRRAAYWFLCLFKRLLWTRFIVIFTLFPVVLIARCSISYRFLFLFVLKLRTTFSELTLGYVACCFVKSATTDSVQSALIQAVQTFNGQSFDFCERGVDFELLWISLWS